MASNDPTQKSISLLKAFVGAKCPQCRQGTMFTKSAFSTGFMETNAHCSVCHLRYEREPGFYWGSMYISFGLTVAIFIAVLVVKSVLFRDMDWLLQYGITVGLLFILSPVMFRTSRVIMLYAFGDVRYNPRLADTSSTKDPKPTVLSEN